MEGSDGVKRMRSDFGLLLASGYFGCTQSFLFDLGFGCRVFLSRLFGKQLPECDSCSCQALRLSIICTIDFPKLMTRSQRDSHAQERGIPIFFRFDHNLNSWNAKCPLPGLDALITAESTPHNPIQFITRAQHSTRNLGGSLARTKR